MENPTIPSISVMGFYFKDCLIGRGRRQFCSKGQTLSRVERMIFSSKKRLGRLWLEIMNISSLEHVGKCIRQVGRRVPLLPDSLFVPWKT